MSSANDPKPPAPIILDLTKDFTPDIISRDQLVHRDSVIKLEKLIEAALPVQQDAAAGYGKFADDGRRSTEKSNNKTFFIDGTRGAGKSTFLNAIAKYLASDKPNFKLYRLPTIDPTMLEAGEQNIFFSILFHLKDAVEDTQVKGSGWGNENREYEDWRKAFQKLARGANLLNNSSGNPQKFDDLLSMDEGIANARSGVQLKQMFHDLLAKTAAILNVNGFIIAFDDVDTHFDKGWEVLELIRRYLQSPHLFVLITGNLQLYIQLVRRHQFQHLGRELHEQDRGRAKERRELVDHLEQQYLMKLFPLQNRVHLAPLGVLLAETGNNPEKPKFLIQTGQAKLALTDHVDHLIRSGLNLRGQAPIMQFRDFLLRQPLRSILQIFRQQHYGNSDTSPHTMARALRGTLMGSLYKLEIDVDALAQGQQGKLIEAVFDAVVRDGELTTGIYLRPQPSDETLRNVYVALAAEVAAQCMDAPHKAIRYLLLAAGSITLLQKQMPADDTTNFVERFKKEMSIGRQENALNWARYAAPSLLSVFDDNRGVGPGLLKLNLGRTNATKYIFDDLLKDPALHPVQQIAFRVATHQVEGNNRLRLYMSLFNLLGAMENLLLLREEMLRGQSVVGQMRHQLGKLGSRLTVTAPSWIVRPAARNSADNIDTDDSDVEPSSILAAQNSEDYFIWWLGWPINNGTHFQPSAFLLGKVWTRLYYSLVKVAGLKLPAGQQMHMSVLCLINAFLVEEYDQLTSDKQMDIVFSVLDRNNPVASADPFFDKLISLQIRLKPEDKFQPLTKFNWENYFPLTMLVLRCPLTLAFLITKQPSDKLMTWLADIIFAEPGSPPFGTASEARNTFLAQLQDGMTKLDRVGVVSRDGSEKTSEGNDKLTPSVPTNGPEATGQANPDKTAAAPTAPKKKGRSKVKAKPNEAANKPVAAEQSRENEATPPAPSPEQDLKDVVQSTELKGPDSPQS